MSFPQSSPDDALPESLMDEAATWVARRDRGLTSKEQDEYLEWLHADPRNAEAMNRHAAAFERMMRLHEWQPAHTQDLNPDLFAPTVRRQWWSRWRSAAAVAAVIAILFIWPRSVTPEPQIATPEKSYLRVNERVALPDGSRVELKDGSHIVVQYSDTERRVRLTSGEAHFTVWKGDARPFVVEVSSMNVVAVGTSFSVRWEERNVEVLVTSGRVKLEQASHAPDAAVAPMVSAGERAVMSGLPANGVPLAAPVITPVSAEEISRALAWQAPRLQFRETPLGEAILHFNRLNRHQLMLADESLSDLRIGGTFRPDNVDAFVRLLEITFRIRAEKRGDYETVLHRRP